MMFTDNGRVIWITGLSGAGKTTLARALQKDFHGSILLDGDELRWALGDLGRGFDAKSRKTLALGYARLAGVLARQGFTVFVATISLFHEIHAWNRKNLPGYMEIFLDVPEEIRRKRDPKGLYAAEKKGSQIAGGEVAVEEPLEPHLRINADIALPDAIELVKKKLNKKQ